MDNKSTNDATTERTLEEELKASLVDGRLPCAVAFEISRKLKVSPKKSRRYGKQAKCEDSQLPVGLFPIVLMCGMNPSVYD